ncbi:hypothetical protein BDN70DRAFT_881529 [Pholiota conissans]|uniref:F-box domain-containing protein n=1 Tax=Pholiota conissans TaxID=109636 RepID=A0A9P5YYZ7_9AGAR|nr:hypothetical protein BDN70DRAFT_881529 [Pholiota conissans]
MAFFSPFKSVLRTNFVPSQSEVEALKHTLEAPSAGSRALADRLAFLMDRLVEKQRTRDALAQSIDAHRNLLTPFRTLPDDVLTEIFLWCLPTVHEAVMDETEAPLLLTTVCRRWRIVAHQMPRLWASLHIAMPHTPRFRGRVASERMQEIQGVFQDSVRRHQRAIILWLDRAKVCPLSISIHDPNASWTADPPAPSYFVILLPFMARIRRLEVDINQQLASDYLAGLPSIFFPNLRALVLRFNRRLRSHLVPIWNQSGLLNAPNLQCLSVLLFPLCFPDIRVNWSSLTHIVATGSSVRKLSIGDALKIFVGCPKLQYCDIDISSSLNAPAVYLPFSLPHLHTLSIISGSTNLAELFQHADIPSLRNLLFFPRTYPAQSQRSPLLTILARTGMNLERLTTNIQFLTLSDLLECFDLVPALTHFSNGHGNVSYSPSQRRMRYSLPVAPRMVSALLGILTPSRDERVYLPKLQVVKFDMNGLQMQVYDKEIMGFVRGRMEFASETHAEVGAQVVPLTRVSFMGIGEKELDLEKEFAGYVADGLVLELSHLGGPFDAWKVNVDRGCHYAMFYPPPYYGQTQTGIEQVAEYL